MQKSGPSQPALPYKKQTCVRGDRHAAAAAAGQLGDDLVDVLEGGRVRRMQINAAAAAAAADAQARRAPPLAPHATDCNHYYTAACENVASTHPS